MLSGQCSILYSHNALWSMFLWRLRSIRLQKNGFPWTCSGIFSKHIAPKSPAKETNRKKPEEVPEEAGRRSQPEAARPLAGMRYNPYL